ncbi:MAG: pilin [Patescibacteria group bacterium]
MKKVTNKMTILLALPLVTRLILLPTSVLAADFDFISEVREFIQDYNPVNTDVHRTPIELLQNILIWMIGFSGLVAVAFIIIGGYQYIMAGGNQENTKKATDTVTKAVIGLVIILAAWLIITTVLGFLS